MDGEFWKYFEEINNMKANAFCSFEVIIFKTELTKHITKNIDNQIILHRMEFWCL